MTRNTRLLSLAGLVGAMALWTPGATAQWLTRATTEPGLLDDLETALVGDVGAAAARRSMAAGEAAFLVPRTPRTCDPTRGAGCTSSLHFWLVNLGSEPLFALSVEVRLRDGSESVVLTERVPVVPAGSAVWLTLESPFQLYRRVRLSELDDPVSDPVEIGYDTRVSGLPLGPAAARALDDFPAFETVRATPEGPSAFSASDAFLLALTHIAEADARRLAQLYVDTLGGPAARERVLRMPTDPSVAILIDALPASELGPLAIEALPHPTDLQRLLNVVQPAQLRPMVPALAEQGPSGNRALLEAAMATADEERFAILESAIGDVDVEGFTAGWRSLRDDALLERRLGMLRRLEGSDAHRDAAARAIVQRLERRRPLSTSADEEVDRIRREAEPAFDSALESALDDWWIVDPEALEASTIDRYRHFRSMVDGPLSACTSRSDLGFRLDECADAIGADDQLSRLAQDGALAPHVLDHVDGSLQHETDPNEYARRASRWVPYGLSAVAMADQLCDSRARVDAEVIDAARRLSPDAKCVRDVDARILGLAPAHFWPALAGLLGVLALLGLIVVRALRRSARSRDALRAAMSEAEDDAE